MRERQINIGSPNPETGEEYKFWNQPAGDFNARYPFNHVYETESGHIMEYDDTPGFERISQFHRSGTNYEIDSSGTKTEYVKGDNYDIRLHDDYMYVKGKVAHTFDDAVMIRYNDRADISAKWKLQIWSGGDLDIHSKRNINMKSDGDINLTSRWTHQFTRNWDYTRPNGTISSRNPKCERTIQDKDESGAYRNGGSW